jgi:hypothetical protein
MRKDKPSRKLGATVVGALLVVAIVVGLASGRRRSIAPEQSPGTPGDTED